MLHSQDSEYSDDDGTDADKKTLLVQENEDKNDPTPNRFLTCTLCFIAAMLGLVLAFPMSILVPESLNLGLTVGQAVLIVSARPATSIIVILIQPSMNKLNNRIYLLLTGIVCFLGFASFYFLVNFPGYQLYLAIFARAVSGTTLFLINNKTVVGITIHLRGDVTTSTALWETFYYLGISGGVAVGTLVDVSIGFPFAMLVDGLLLLGTVFLLALVFPSPLKELDEENSEPDLKELMSFAWKSDMLVYCWLPMLCIGAGANFTEGVTTQFFKSQYGKSLAFGGFLELVTMVTYTFTAAFLGMLRNRWPVLNVLGLVIGFLGAGLTAPFIGPLSQVSVQNNMDIVESGIAVNVQQMFFCGVLLNSPTVSALVLSKELPTDTATSLAVNLTNAAYALGSIVGPAIGGQLLMRYSFPTVWAVGLLFYIPTSVVVGMYAYLRNAKNDLPLTEKF